MSKQQEDKKTGFDFGNVFGDFTTEQIQEAPVTLEDQDDELEQEIAEREAAQKKEKTTKPKAEEVEEIEEQEEEEDIQEEVSDSEEQVEYSYKAIASYLSEEGILDFEDSEDLEDSIDVLEEAVHNRIISGINEYKESIPEQAKEILEYLEKGGDINNYIKALEKPLDFSNLDLEDESTQKKVLRQFLELQEYSKEEIEEELKDYEDGLILGKKATTAAKKLEKYYEKQKEAEIAKQSELIAKQKKQQEDYISEVKSTIDKSSALAGLSLSTADKKDFEKYLLARDKEGFTAYQRELNENPLQTQLELAYLKFKKYDFSKIANKVKTEETKRIRNLIKNSEKSNKGKSSNQTPAKKADLSGFRKLL